MRILIIAIIAAACGLTVAIAIALGGNPVTLQDLPALGYSLGLRGEPVNGVYCYDYYVLSGNGAPETLIGDLPPACSSAAQEQARIDSLLANFPPPGAAPVTVTLPAVTVTVTTPAVTTTVQADPLPAVTLPTVTVKEIHTETVTVTETVVGPTVTGPTVTLAAPEIVAPWLVAISVRSAGMNLVYGLV